MTIKQEPVSIIRIGQKIFQKQRARGTRRIQKGVNSTGTGNRRCYNCDAPNFTLDHFADCPAKGVTCNASRNLGHFERTCRGVRRG